MDIFIKGLLGAAITIAIAILSRTKIYYLSGLLVLFPSCALIAHYISMKEVGVVGLKDVVLFGIFSLLPYLSYLVGIFYFADKYEFKYSVLISLILWLVTSILIIYLWEYYRG